MPPSYIEFPMYNTQNTFVSYYHIFEERIVQELTIYVKLKQHGRT